MRLGQAVFARPTENISQIPSARKVHEILEIRRLRAELQLTRSKVPDTSPIFIYPPWTSIVHLHARLPNLVEATKSVVQYVS